MKLNPQFKQWLTIVLVLVIFPYTFIFAIYKLHSIYAPSSLTTAATANGAAALKPTMTTLPAKLTPTASATAAPAPGTLAVPTATGTASAIATSAPANSLVQTGPAKATATAPVIAPPAATETNENSSGSLMIVSALIIGVCMLAGSFVTRSAMKKPTGKKAIGKNLKSLREGKKLTWDDIGGCPEAVKHFKRLARWTLRQEFYRKHKARMPKGVLLKGPPGTGKTLIARILCFVLDGDGVVLSGSDFVEMFVGVGAAKVRQVFDPARKYVRETGKPYVIVIDEIDAVGGHRAGPGANKHDEREQTLNALLVELDGIMKEEGIIVIGMTNRPDMLDPALIRPGRLEYHIEIGLPDITGREQILAIHMAGKKVAADATPSRIASQTYGMSGADLAFIANNAAIAAADRSIKAYEATHPEVKEAQPEPKEWNPFGDQPPVERKEIADIEISEITYSDIDQAIEDLLLGEKMLSKQASMRQRDKVETVTHEVGHAVAQSIFPFYDPISLVSAQRRTKSLGVVLSMPDYDKVSLDKRTALARIVVALAGRQAQLEHLGTEDAGVLMDYQQATDHARRMVMAWGMSKLGAMSVDYRPDGSRVDISEGLKAEIDKTWREIIAACDATAAYIIKTEKARMIRGVEELSAKETIAGRDWRTLMENTPSAVVWTDLPLFKEFKQQEERLGLSQKPTSWWQRIIRRRQ